MLRGGIEGVQDMAVINGTSGNDSLLGTNAADNLSGLAGNDSLQGGGGYDELTGGDGDDLLADSLGGGQLQGGAGNDTLTLALSGAGTNFPYAYGGDGNDSIIATGRHNNGYSLQAFGEAGNDTLSGSTDNDYLDGGSGNDSVLDDIGNDNLRGGGGTDVLDGGAGNDTLNDNDSWGGADNPFDWVGNGHYYARGTGSLTWSQAQAAAAATSFAGKQGYLATITSAEEQAFLYATFGGSTAWIGASDAATEGTWQWVTGPEAGSTFYVKGAAAQPGYSAWPAGEPNNSNNEDYASFSYHSLGAWNDLSATAVWGNYLIEYGGMSGDAASLLGAGDTLTGGVGDDSITSLGLGDIIDGGAGTDTVALNLRYAPAALIFSAPAADVPVTLPGGGSVVNVETYNIIATGAGDSIIGGAGNDNLDGDDGNDSLQGGGG